MTYLILRKHPDKKDFWEIFVSDDNKNTIHLRTIGPYNDTEAKEYLEGLQYIIGDETKNLFKESI